MGSGDEKGGVRLVAWVSSCLRTVTSVFLHFSTQAFMHSGPISRFDYHGGVGHHLIYLNHIELASSLFG